MTKENSAGLATLLHDGEAKWLATTMVLGSPGRSMSLCWRPSAWRRSRTRKISGSGSEAEPTDDGQQRSR
jgi:hypothetical protein